jgi:choline dehydrogenase-like flavoprotein
MEIDARTTKLPAVLRTRVCVVGGGIAGIVLAHRLRAQRVDVLLLEAGGRTRGESPADPVDGDAAFTARIHEGTRADRTFAFGGSSLRWGGQLLALDPLAARGWPVEAEALRRFTAEAEQLLQVDGLPYEAAAFFAAIQRPMPSLLQGWSAVEPRVSKWMSFSERNLAATLGQQLLRDTGAQVVLGARAVSIELDRGGERVCGIEARTEQGEPLRIEADAFVLAAGTVETARLLLASRGVHRDGVGNAHDQVGRGLHDHLTLPVATLQGDGRALLLEQLRPWVTKAPRGHVLHSLKLIAGAELRERLGLLPVLAHMTIEEPADRGVALLRRTLLSRQQQMEMASVSRSLAQAPGAMLDAARLAWQAQVRGRRYVSPQARVQLYVNTAQECRAASRIRLSEQLDRLGVPLPCVDWDVTEREAATLRSFTRWLRERLQASGVRGLQWEAALLQEGPALRQLDDARHAMGGARMGLDPKTSVVDPTLHVHGVKNLAVAGLAVMPDGAAHLPTLTMVALTLQLADRLAQQHGASR